MEDPFKIATVYIVITVYSGISTLVSYAYIAKYMHLHTYSCS